MKKGPGQELREIFASIGIKPKKTCKCSAITQWMDEIGVDGCKRDRNAIVREICAGIKNYSASEVAFSIVRMVESGLSMLISPLDPIGSLYDVAVRRAEENK